MAFATTVTCRRVIACIAMMMNLVPIQSGHAKTPWGLIGSRVIGRVEQLSQAPSDGQPGFDVASVILRADAPKVYAAAVDRLRSNPVVRVVNEDAAASSVSFSNGARSAKLTVSALGPHLSQIIVASARKPDEASATLRIVDGILHVCQALNVACRQQ